MSSTRKHDSDEAKHAAKDAEKAEETFQDDESDVNTASVAEVAGVERRTPSGTLVAKLCDYTNSMAAQQRNHNTATAKEMEELYIVLHGGPVRAEHLKKALDLLRSNLEYEVQQVDQLSSIGADSADPLPGWTVVE